MPVGRPDKVSSCVKTLGKGHTFLPRQFAEMVPCSWLLAVPCFLNTCPQICMLTPQHPSEVLTSKGCSSASLPKLASHASNLLHSVTASSLHLLPRGIIPDTYLFPRHLYPTVMETIEESTLSLISFTAVSPAPRTGI